MRIKAPTDIPIKKEKILSPTILSSSAMAVLFRCFSPPTRPSPPHEFSGGNRTSEDVVFLPFRKKNVALLSTRVHVSVRVYVSADKGLNVPSNEPKSSDGKLSEFCLVMLKSISDHQRIASFSITKAFVLGNSLMLMLPLEALAETCEADNSNFNMPLLFGIALIGATVGGLLARQRRGELKRLNDQLRQINSALRRQAKIESYAPNLSYAPVGRTPEAEVIVDPRKQELITNLRTGKNYLRNQDPEKAFTEFKAAFILAQALGDHVEEKKAARGLGASLQRQGKYKDAIKYHSRVLEISKQVGEDSGTTEAYGAIADCYTELGDLERAGKFYDQYIVRLDTD